ncbi:MAG: hypothetical protein WBL95_02765 [Microcoleus sp.]
MSVKSCIHSCGTGDRLFIVILSGVGIPIRVKFGKDVGLELLERRREGRSLFSKLTNKLDRLAIALLNLKIYILCLAVSGATAQVAVLADDN